MSGDVRTVVNARFPRATRNARVWAGGWNRLGEQAAFYVQGLASIREALIKYSGETLRVVSEMSLGVGALALIGGEVVILSVFAFAAYFAVIDQIFLSLINKLFNAFTK